MYQQHATGGHWPEKHVERMVLSHEKALPSTF
jgi:hypothetical protein